MILTCPECGTQYVVKDGAIPPDGRQVRCAACKHSWHQDPEPDAPGTPDDGGQSDRMPAEREGARDEQESAAEATLIEPRSGPEAEERAYEEAVIEGNADELATDQPNAEMTDAPLEDIDTAEAAPSSEDWNDPPHAEAAGDTFSPFAEGDGVE